MHQLKKQQPRHSREKPGTLVLEGAYLPTSLAHQGAPGSVSDLVSKPVVRAFEEDI